MLEITKDDLLWKEHACLVEIYTPSCPYCKMLEKKLAELQKNGAEFPIYRMNAENEPAFCEEFGIRSVPVLIRFENGKETARRVGNVSAKEIEELMQ